MALPLIQGGVDYGSSGTIQYIPEVFSGRTLTQFYEKSILTEITNTNYEGDIKKKGDKVIIRTDATTPALDYVNGQDIVFANPESTSTSISADKAKYHAVSISDVDLDRVDINVMSQWENDSVQAFKTATGREVLQNIYTDVSVYNQGATAGKDTGSINLGTVGAPLVITSANILDLIINAGVTLDEQNVPEDDVKGWWIAMPPWAVALIKSSSLMDASITGDSKSILRSNGRIGMIDRMRVYKTNQLYHNGTAYWNILYGTSDATSFVTQITETKTVDFEKAFGRGIKSLMVYGYKVLRPVSLGLIVAKR